jgi:hypothetical protein
LQIEAYFQQILETIETCPALQSFTFTPEKRDTSEGFIRGEIKFKDGSTLYIREFITVEFSIERDMYSYQFMSANNQLIFRYDNTGHHRKLNLPNFPHHKHDGNETTIIPSDAPTLKQVLNEITSLLA